MDDASENKNLETNSSPKYSNGMSDDRDVFQPIWVRFFIQDGNGLDEFLLDYGRTFLPRIGIVFFVIYCFQKIF